MNSIFCGNTPLITLEGIYVKCEHINPSGSVKDRIANYFFKKAEESGILHKGDTIVEASTGNTGIALSMVGAAKGYKVKIFVPKGLSEERYKIMKLLGAKLVFVPKDRTDIARKKAQLLGKKNGFVHFDQFANPWNDEEHEKGMGAEIISQLKGKKIDAVVAGIGSGGTIIGLTKAFRKVNSSVKAYGVEPMECSLVDSYLNNKSSRCGHHLIEGIADGFVPEIIKRNKNILDGIIKVKSMDAVHEAQRIARHNGMLVGICSGANFLAAKKIMEEQKLKTVVTIFTDSGARYLSEKWFCKF